MEIYVLQDGQQKGPFHLHQLRDMADNGLLSREDLGWMRGADSWRPLADIEAVGWIFERAERNADAGDGTPPDGEPEPDRSLPPPLPAPSDADEAPNEGAALAPIRPWVRFWARGIDLTLFLALISAVTIPFGWLEKRHAVMAPSVQFMVLVTVAWALVEAFMLSTWGTTPGKALLRISVRAKESPQALLSLAQALKRSLLVCFFGFGFGLTPLRELSLALSYYQLRQSGRTFWDHKLDLTVTHERIGPLRTTIAVAIIAGWSLVSLWIAFQEPSLREALQEAVEQARQERPSA